MQWIDWIVLVAYLIGIVFVILKVRQVKSMEDFAVASRSVTGPIVFATLSASIVGPGYVLGLSERGFSVGYTFFFITLMFSIQTIFTAFVIAPRIQTYKNAYTIGDIVGHHYGLISKRISGLLSFLYCAGIVGVVAKASGDLISYFTGLDFMVAAIISTVVVILYSTHGGIKAVVVTDVVQFVVLTICIPLVLFMVLGDADLGAFSKTYKASFGSLFDGFTSLELIALMVSFLLGEALVPPYVSRALMAKSPSHAKKGFMYAGVFMVFWFFIVISLGVFGKFVSGSSDGDQLFFDLLSKYAPVGLLGLISAALISVIMSTKDSFLNAASVTFTFDLFNRSKEKEKSNLRFTQYTNVLTGALAVAFALSIPNLIAAIVKIFTFWAPSVVLPLMIGVVRKKVNPLSGLLAITMGLLSTGLVEFGFVNVWDVPSVIVGLLANQLFFWLIELINPSVSWSQLSPLNCK